MTKATVLFPGWRFGPNGECELFQRAEDVPDGWTREHPANRAEPAGAARGDPFDHDGDGKPGGSLPGRRGARKVNRRGNRA
jgi:hypothetical protein